MQLVWRGAFAFAMLIFVTCAADAHLTAPSSGRTVDIVVEGDTTETLHAFGDALVPKLRNIEGITRADDGEREIGSFLASRLWFFLSLDDLRVLHAEISERWDWEVTRELGEALDDTPPPLIDRNHHVRDLRAWFESNQSDYFETKNGDALVVVARARTMDDAAQSSTFARIREVVTALRGDPRFGSIRIGYAGNISSDVDEYHRRTTARLGLELLAFGGCAIALALATRKLSRRGAVAWAVFLVLCAGTSRVTAQREAQDHPQSVATAVLGTAKPIALVPDDQVAKIAEINAIAEIIATARKHALITGKNSDDFARYIPPTDLRPFTARDL